MEAATTVRPEAEDSQQPTSSFAKSLFCGEIHEEMVFPWPEPDADEQEKVRRLIAAAREIEKKRWLGDRLVRELGDRGLCGLYVPERYGGQGLSQTGYARVFETFAQIDSTLSIVMGVHQSIGFKGIHLFGTDEQKERFLPDLACGRKLAGFALTEPNAGSDAYNIESRAVKQPVGSWLLSGEKRYIGNGGTGSVFTTFARCEVDGKESHVALILERKMKGFEVGERYDTMGLRGNDLRRLYFRDVRVPPENVLGEPGEGFRIAMHVLNNGRIQREVRPDRITAAHPELSELADSVSDQVKELRGITESLLREHRGGIVERQFAQKRIADSIADIYAQFAVLSRVTLIFEDQGVEPSGEERYIAETFCTRAGRRVRARLNQISENDDERMSAIAKLAYKRGAYGYALFEG